MTDKYALLNPGEDKEMELFGYRTERWRHTLCILGYIGSLGFLLMAFNWKPEWDVWCHCVPCTLEEADVVLLRTTDELKQYSKKKVMVIHPNVSGIKPGHQIIADANSIISKSVLKPECRVRYIKIQKIRYVWNTSEGKFQKIGVLEDEHSCSDIHCKFGSGLTSEEQKMRQQVCGLNTIEVEIVPIWKLLFKEIFNPFYIFQAYSLSIWIATGYSEYSSAIILMTLMSVTATVYNLRVQSVKLHKMADSYNSIMVTVLHKNGVLEEVKSQSLVPGDVIILAGNKLYLPCDAILVSGGCTVNEGMLTGESIPVTKTPLPHVDNSVPWKTHSGEDYKRHVLFCGTEVIQTKPHGRDLVKAVVLQTGFNTAKGDLVRSILYNKPVSVKLHREAIRFLLGLVAIALFGVIYTAVVYSKNGASVHDIVLMSFLMLTIAVNAALPAALTLAILYAQTRLKEQGIFCISPQRINVSGQLNLICFDKTGTLTEDVLDLWGVVPSEGKCFQEVHHFPSSNGIPWGPLLGAMASCHSLILLDGKMHGDPLDLKMFEGTGWELEDYETESSAKGQTISCTMVKPGASAGKVSVEGIAILHQFPFSSSLQRMSVITQVLPEEELTVCLKGAPEMVIRFCKPETVPHSFSKRLDYYTMQGFRVIGLAYRVLDKNDLSKIEQLEREEVESNLIFLGLLIMENRLKPETKAVLQELSAANIRTVMITGDNLQTALTVGKSSGMIPHASKLILMEAMEPSGSKPASITWQTMAENQENGHASHESNIDIHGGWNGTTTEESGPYHFAISGKSYQVILQNFYNLVPKILLNGTIFARMTPRQKSNLIEEFQKLDYYVGMCGDGANDCGALKMAHAGISLSELEASVASPFTSKIPNIECVPKLINKPLNKRILRLQVKHQKMEGRNALVTSFSMFKFLTMFTLIGLTCILLLFWKQTLLGNYQYLMQDLAITITVSLTLSLNGPASKLAPYRPSGQLLSPPLLLSVVLHFIFSLIVQTTAFILVQQQPWYNESDVFSACLPANESTGNVTLIVPKYSENYLTTTMWPVTGMNLIVVEFVFSKGRPFRKRLYTNYLLSFVITVQVAVYLFILFADIEGLYTAMELVCTPYYWRIYIFIMLLVLFIVSYAAEEGIIENRRLWLLIKRIFNYQSKSQYRKLQVTLEKDPDWPPQDRTDYASQPVSVMDSKVVVYTNPAYRNPTQHKKDALHEETTAQVLV